MQNADHITDYYYYLYFKAMRAQDLNGAERAYKKARKYDRK